MGFPLRYRDRCTSPAVPMSWRQSLSVLRFAHYRRLWFGLAISMFGSNMRNAAVLWHITLLAPADERALALGALGLARVVPIVGCSLFAGVLADAVDRRRLLLTVNSVLLFVSTALAVLTHLELIGTRGLYVLAAFMAGASTFDNPARNSYFPMLVPRVELPHAIALNSLAFHVSAALGPALGGLVIAGFGVAAVYVVDAATFAAIVLLLLRIPKDAARVEGTQRGEVSRAAAWDGIRFVFGNPLIRSSMLLDFAATFFASATFLLPIYAQDILQVGASGYGILSSAMAVGSVLVSFVAVPLLGRIVHRGKALLWAVAAYGVMTICFGLSRWFWFSFACLLLAGAADTVSTLCRQIIRQLETPDSLRGRMASVNMLFFQGGPQLGELEAGLVAHALSPVASVVSGGAACLLAVAWVAAKVPVLRNYRSP
jgi:MFS family permease